MRMVDTKMFGFFRNKKTRKLVRLDASTSTFGGLLATTLLPSPLGVRTTDERAVVLATTLPTEWDPVYTVF